MTNIQISHSSLEIIESPQLLKVNINVLYFNKLNFTTEIDAFWQFVLWKCII